MSEFKFYVGITDKGWYERLSKLKPDEVNFWRPSGQGLRVIGSGDIFLFKLHSPDNYIVGGGVLTRFLKLPVSLAWDIFKEKNGVARREDLIQAIGRYRRSPIGRGEDPEIGCILLNEPFFFPREEWVPVPQEGWGQGVQVGKSFTTGDSVGGSLWGQVMDRLQASDLWRTRVAEPEKWYGKRYIREARLGQSGFRAHITEAYERRCAVTGAKILPVLEAAHIKPYADGGQHRVDNGLLLRSDVHRLFDKGFITVTPDYHIEVSKQVKDRYDNGKEYYKFHGKKLFILPKVASEKPAQEFLEQHNSEIYLD